MQQKEKEKKEKRLQMFKLPLCPNLTPEDAHSFSRNSSSNPLQITNLLTPHWRKQALTHRYELPEKFQIV